MLSNFQSDRFALASSSSSSFLSSVNSVSSGKFARILLCSALIGLGSLSMNAWADKNRAMSVEQQTIVNIAVPQSDLKVDLWSDRSNGVYADGERARLFLKVNQTARVELVDVSASGVKTVLFPNACQTNNLLQANQTIEVGIGQAGNLACPGIRVSAPYGLSVLKATATTDQAARLASSSVVISPSNPFAQISGDAKAYARSMAVIVNQAAPAAKWATTSLNYSVVPAQAQAQAPSAIASQPTQIVVTNGSSSQTVQVIVPGAAPGTQAQPTPAPVATAPVATAPQQPVAPVATTLPAAYPMPTLQSDFALQVLPQQKSYRVGDTLSFSVTAERRCDLRVMNVTPKGQVEILYPNALHKTITLTPGVATFLPASNKEVRLALSGEPGTQTLVAICAQNKSFWETLTGKSVQSVAQPTMTLEQILNDKGDGLVARTHVNFDLNP